MILGFQVSQNAYCSVGLIDRVLLNHEPLEERVSMLLSEEGLNNSEHICKLDDRELLILLKDDPDVFWVLWERHSVLVEKLSLLLTKNYHDAEDLSSQSMMHACSKLEKYSDSITNFPAWLRTLVKNLFIDKYRSRRSELLCLESLGINEREKQYSRCHVKDLISRESYSVLCGIISSLPTSLRDVSYSYFIHGMSYQEICSEYEHSYSLVRKKIQRARQKIIPLVKTVSDKGIVSDKNVDDVNDKDCFGMLFSNPWYKAVLDPSGLESWTLCFDYKYSSRHLNSEADNLLNQADRFFWNGEYWKAESLYIKSFGATEVHGKNIDLVKVKLHVCRSQFREAVKFIRLKGCSERQGGESLLLFGICLFHVGEYSTSVSMFNRLLSNDPENLPALYYRIKALINCGKYGLAVTFSEKLVVMQPHCMYAKFLYVNSKVISDGQSDDCRYQLLDMWMNGERNPEFLPLLVKLFAEDITVTDKVIAYLRKSLRCNPAALEKWHALGSSLLYCGLYDDAGNALTMSYNLDQMNTHSCSSLSNFLFSKKSYNENRYILERCIRNFPRCANFYVMKAQNEVADGFHDSASETYVSALKMDSGNLNLWLEYCFFLVASSEKIIARKAMLKIKEIYCENSYGILLKGRIKELSLKLFPPT